MIELSIIYFLSLKFFCFFFQAQETDDETVPQLRTWFAFYTTTLIGVMETGKIKEEFIALMLPHISQGLKSNIPNYKAATYMILAELFHKVTLKEKLLTTLMNTICKVLVIQNSCLTYLDGKLSVIKKKLRNSNG